jgi:hypothetical protein
MCKGQHINHLEPVQRHSLDTLDSIEINTNQRKLQKRAQSKHLTQSIALKLASVKTSPLIDGYWDSYYCGSTILQENGELRSTFCNRKWCVVCGRIKTMKAIKGYLPQLETLNNPHLVTLTARNVSGDFLPTELKRFQKVWSTIRRHFNYHNVEFKGVRKLECTTSIRAKTYNPHYHILVNGEHQAKRLVELWVHHLAGDADIKGQKVQKVRKVNGDLTKDLMEVFKYTAKVIVKGEAVPAQMLDTIYQATHRGKTLQGFGGIKSINENIAGDKTPADWIEDRVDVWNWDKELSDWVSILEGDKLSHYKPDEPTLNNIKILQDEPDNNLTNQHRDREPFESGHQEGQKDTFRDYQSRFKDVFESERTQPSKDRDSVLNQLELRLHNWKLN